jgi:hypothetical protein
MVLSADRASVCVEEVHTSKGPGLALRVLEVYEVPLDDGQSVNGRPPYDANLGVVLPRKWWKRYNSIYTPTETLGGSSPRDKYIEDVSA